MKLSIATITELKLMTHDLKQVMWGDGILVDIYARYSKNDTSIHPLTAMNRVLNALAKDDRFEAFKIRGHDSRGRDRIVRGFKLKELTEFDSVM